MSNRHASVSSNYPGQSVSQYTFGFPFCQCPWNLTKRRDDIAVADMEVHMAVDMEVDMVADKMADMVNAEK